MFVVSSRPKRTQDEGQWIVLESYNGNPPSQPIAGPKQIPEAVLDSLKDPLVILIHGYNNTEAQAFEQYAQQIGRTTSQGLLYANGFAGSVIGYDWPSTESDATTALQVYKGDLKAAVTIGAPVLADFLEPLATALSGSGIRVNLMAHSMGNLLLRTMFLSQPQLAARLDNIFSLAPDILHIDLEKEEMKEAAHALSGNWFVYWAQADVILLSLSNWANIILGSEKWRGQRLGQQGPRDKRRISRKVVVQQWDAPLAQDLGSHYNWDTRQWQFNHTIHSRYWTNAPFLQNVAQNMQRHAGSNPIVKTWPLPPRP
jgi:esterase/lipase superfamily enzyme